MVIMFHFPLFNLVSVCILYSLWLNFDGCKSQPGVNAGPERSSTYRHNCQQWWRHSNVKCCHYLIILIVGRDSVIPCDSRSKSQPANPSKSTCICNYIVVWRFETLFNVTHIIHQHFCCMLGCCMFLLPLPCQVWFSPFYPSPNSKMPHSQRVMFQQCSIDIAMM